MFGETKIRNSEIETKLETTTYHRLGRHLLLSSLLAHTNVASDHLWMGVIITSAQQPINVLTELKGGLMRGLLPREVLHQRRGKVQLTGEDGQQATLEWATCGALECPRWNVRLQVGKEAVSIGGKVLLHRLALSGDSL